MATTIVYLDSSVALRTILDVPARERLQQWMQTPETTYVSSRLLRTEVIRVLRRDGRPLTDGAPLLDRVGMLTGEVPQPSAGKSRKASNRGVSGTIARKSR